MFVAVSSSNGTLVNGVRLKKGEEKCLDHCDTLTVALPNIFSATVLLAADLQSASVAPAGGKKRALDDVDADSADDDRGASKKKGLAADSGKPADSKPADLKYVF